MTLPEMVRRASIAGLAALVLAAVAAFPAAAKDPPAAAVVPALPEPLTREAVRDLVARLSDDEVEEAPARPARSRRRAGARNFKSRQRHVGNGRPERRNGAHAPRRVPGCPRRAAADAARRHCEAGQPRGAFCVTARRCSSGRGAGGRLACATHVRFRAAALSQEARAAADGDLHGPRVSTGSRSCPGSCRDRRVRACLSRDIPRALAGARPAADRNTGVADRGRRRADHVALRRVPAFAPRRGGAAPAVRRRPCAAVALVRRSVRRALGPRQFLSRGIDGRRERTRRRSISC